MSDAEAEKMHRDIYQLFDEFFQRSNNGAMPGDGTWGDFIKLATSLAERYESAGFPDSAEHLRQFIECLETGIAPVCP